MFAEARDQARQELADHFRAAVKYGPEYLDAVLAESVNEVTRRPAGLHPRIAELVREVAREAPFVGMRS